MAKKRRAQKKKKSLKKAASRKGIVPGISKLCQYRHLARVAIECSTPLHVGNGGRDEVADAGVVTDANGLAAIPGTSLAGLLRQAYAALPGVDDAAVNDVFGGREGAGSRLSVSWGHVHDRRDRPVVGLRPRRELLADPVLLAAFLPEIREHVRLSPRGAADRRQRGLFSEAVVCAGHRFTFELELVGKEGEEEILRQLIDRLHDPTLRLGGKTRRGYGAFTVVRAYVRSFHLKERTQFREYGNFPVNLAGSMRLQHRYEPRAAAAAALVVSLRLFPSSFWFFGNGSDPDGVADMASFREGMIAWEEDVHGGGGERGKYRENVVVLPAAAVKGALAHRTAFHYNRLLDCFADCLLTPPPAPDESGFAAADEKIGEIAGGNNLAVRQIYGFAKQNSGAAAAAGTGRPGRLLIDDLYLSVEPPGKLVYHAPLGRFSGGTLNLFTERPFWRGDEITFRFSLVDPENIKQEGWTVTLPDGRVVDPVRHALVCALEDLAEKRLPLGSGSGRGEGYWQRAVNLDDQEGWKELKKWSENGGATCSGK